MTSTVRKKGSGARVGTEEGAPISEKSAKGRDGQAGLLRLLQEWEVLADNLLAREHEHRVVLAGSCPSRLAG